MPPGPLLFFSGGSALRDVAALLARCRIASVHLMSPFDSGGSSGVLREAFSMPAVGDIRARSLSLAPCGAPETAFFDFRFSQTSEHEAFAALERLLQGVSPLLEPFSAACREGVLELLRSCVNVWPQGADLRGASVGNLVLAALYLLNGRNLDEAARRFGEMVHAFGIVCPVAEGNAHLRVQLDNGDIVTGQHRFTGKFFSPVRSPVRRLSLTCPVEATEAARQRIAEAGRVWYPVGSFYSSVLAGLLPSGMDRALEAARCPKVFLPNPLPDPELLGHTLLDQLVVLRRYAPVTHLLVDAGWHGYPGGIPDNAMLKKMGIQRVSSPILLRDGHLDAAKTLAALASLRT